MSNKTIYIYILIDPRDNNVRYVGKTHDLKHRYYCHTNHFDGTKKSAWIKSIKAIGISPEIDVVEITDEKNWIFWEQHYISLFKFYGFNLTNSTQGGEGGLMSKETKEKMRNAMLNATEEHKKKISIALTGKKPSKQTLLRLRKSHLHQKNENLRKPVIQKELNGNFIRDFVSVSEAARVVCGSVRVNRNIVRAIKNNLTCGGYKWEYKNKVLNNAE